MPDKNPINDSETALIFDLAQGLRNQRKLIDAALISSQLDENDIGELL